MRFFSRFRFVTALLFFIFSFEIHAHYVTPQGIKMYLGETRTFTVSDPGSCSATVYAVSGDTSLVQVINPASGFGVGISVTFTVEASATNTGDTVIVVDWVGEHVGTEGPCQEDTKAENNTHYVAIRVIDPKDASAANHPESGTANDPINTHTGELVLDEAPDIVMDGPMPLVFERYYASSLRRSFVVSRIGDNWRHNYDWDIHFVGNVLVIVDNKGRVIRYLKSNTQTNEWEQKTNLATPYPVIQQIETLSNHFYLFDPREMRIYKFSVPDGDVGYRLVEIQDTKGNKLTLTYDTDPMFFSYGLLKKVEDGLGRELSFYYQYLSPTNPSPAFMKLQSVSNNSQRSVSFTYDEELLVSVTDVNGNSTEYVYDTAHNDSGLMRYKKYPKGNIPYEQTWDDQGRVATQKDANGNVSTLAYANQKTDITNPRNTTASHTHTATGQLSQASTANSNTRSLENDSKGRRTSVTQPLGGKTSKSFNQTLGKIVSRTDANGNTIQYEYVTRTIPPGFETEDLTAIHYPDGFSVTYTYDANGNRTGATSRGGQTWTYTYNDRGQVLTQKNPTNAEFTTTYYADGMREKFIDPFQNETVYEYDALKRITKIIRPDNSYRTFTYDNTNRLKTITNENQKTMVFSYNNNGEMTHIQDPAGNATARAYDDNGRILSITDRNGETVSFAYNDLGLLGSVSMDVNDFDLAWDDDGKFESLALPGGQSVASQVDANGRANAMTDANGNTSSVELSDTNLITAETNAEGKQITYEYDSLGRMTQRMLPGGETEHMEYDANGQITKIDLPDAAIQTTFKYNSLGRMEELTDPNMSAWKFEHNTIGETTAHIDPLGNKQTFEYDKRRRLSKVTFPGGLGDLLISYDDTGRATKRAFSDGVEINYTYDDLGRMRTTNGVTLDYDNEGRLIESNGLTATREPFFHGIKVLTLAPGKTVTYTYDMGQVTKVVDWLGATMSFEYDNAGKLKKITRANTHTTDFTLDKTSRVTAIDHGSLGAISLTRNDSGNIISVDNTLNVPALPTVSDQTFSVNAAHQLNGHTYDALGRLKDDGQRQYNWDLAGRLTSYQQDTKQIDFTYNGFGHLIARTDNGVAREFVWNYLFAFPAVSIIKEAGQDVIYQIHHPSGTLLYQIMANDNSYRYFHYDERGNTVLVTNGSGDTIAAYAYSPFGIVSADDDALAAANEFTFAGQYGVMQEADTGLYFMGQRIYDSQAGRFISKEPVAPHLHPLTFNPYQFAANNPLNFFDPTGFDTTNVDAANQQTTASDVWDVLSNQVADTAMIGGEVGARLGSKADDLAKAATSALGASLSIGHEVGRVIEQNLGGNALTQKYEKIANNYFKAFEAAEARSGRLGSASKPLKAIGQVGNVLTAASIGVELWKLFDKSFKAYDEHNEILRGHYQTFVSQSQTAWEIFEKEKKSVYWLRQKLNDAKYHMQMGILHSEYLYDVNFMYNFWVAVGNIWGAFLPDFGLLEVERAGNWVHQHGLYPDLGLGR